MNGTRISFRHKGDLITHTEEFWGENHAQSAQQFAKDHGLVQVDVLESGKWVPKIIGKADFCQFQPVNKPDAQVA